MRMFLLAGAVVALCASSAQADDLMATRIGNTTISKGGGPEVHMYYNADGTFSGKIIGMKIALKGTWKEDGSTVCLIYDPVPPTVKNPMCLPLEAHQVGDTWTAGARTVTLAQGIQ